MRKAGVAVILITLFTGSLPVAPLFAKAPKDDKPKTLFLQIKGPQDSVTELREAFEKAAGENDLTLTDNSRHATVSLEITINENKEREVPISAELISATQSLADGTATPVYSCKSVADDKGTSTTKHTWGKTSLLPAPTDKKKKVFLENGKSHLADTVRQEVMESGFEVTAVEADADIRLTGITLIKKSIRTMMREQRIETRMLMTGGQGSFTTNVRFYKSIVEPLDSAVETCRSTLDSFLQTNSVHYNQVVTLQMYLINKRFNQ